MANRALAHFAVEESSGIMRKKNLKQADGQMVTSFPNLTIAFRVQPVIFCSLQSPERMHKNWRSLQQTLPVVDKDKSAPKAMPGILAAEMSH
ncbi:hypothetical protein Y032_0329g2663 [Ancylostoma ceylanicum]|uniref:Uncharacterized protein n=1 Tax=Ancylostoma ceylanicum TaxID=53326 RepID=A0A016RZR6_9BILA|nr:hypothetical protein Y032_0329g2663 [Ancylostoma ceylanicum]